MGEAKKWPRTSVLFHFVEENKMKNWAIRYLGIVICTAAIGTAPAIGSEYPPELVSAAKKEGKLVIYCSHRRKIMNPASKEFERLFGIKVDHTRKSSKGVIRIVEAERMAGRQRVDIICIGDRTALIRWGKEKEVIPYQPKNKSMMDPILRPRENFINDKYVLNMAITYNTKKVAKSEVPKTWKDLLDPKWKDRIVMAAPSTGSGLATFGVLLKKYGWNYYKKLARNRPLIVMQSKAGEVTIIRGERDIGPGVVSVANKLRRKGEPIGIALMEDVTPMFLGGSVIWKHGGHPNAAKLWMEFELSKFYQNLIVQQSYFGVRKDMPLPKGAPSLSGLNRETPDYKWLLANKTKLLKKFDKIMGKHK